MVPFSGGEACQQEYDAGAVKLRIIAGPYCCSLFPCDRFDGSGPACRLDRSYELPGAMDHHQRITGPRAEVRGSSVTAVAVPSSTAVPWRLTWESVPYRVDLAVVST